jgi:hypothetical protein
VTTPLPLGIGTVSEDVLPANDTAPLIVVGEPLVGLNTIAQTGVLRPPFPFPVGLKSAQLKVTDAHFALATTVCAAALAAEIASMASATMIV